jgi:hypothetical protein
MFLKRIFKPLIEVVPPLDTQKEKQKNVNLIVIENNKPKLQQADEVLTPQPPIKKRKKRKDLVELEVIESPKPESQKVLYEVATPVDVIPQPDNMTVQRLKLVKPTRPFDEDQFSDFLRNDEIRLYPKHGEISLNDSEWQDQMGQKNYQYYDPIDKLLPPDNMTVQRLTIAEPTRPTVNNNQFSDFLRNNQQQVYPRNREIFQNDSDLQDFIGSDENKYNDRVQHRENMPVQRQAVAKPTKSSNNYGKRSRF